MTFFGSSLLVFALVTIAGCDSGPQTERVTGVVTFDGENVQKGTVTFYPVSGGKPAVGKIQPNGVYELSTFEPGDGALRGEHAVAIEARQVNSTAFEPKSLEEEIAQANAPAQPVRTFVVWLVPEEFSSAESSGLTATVNGGLNEIDFRLP